MNGQMSLQLIFILSHDNKTHNNNSQGEHGVLGDRAGVCGNTEIE
jgi:hypothetical protein